MYHRRRRECSVFGAACDSTIDLTGASIRFHVKRSVNAVEPFEEWSTADEAIEILNPSMLLAGDAGTLGIGRRDSP